MLIFALLSKSDSPGSPVVEPGLACLFVLVSVVLSTHDLSLVQFSLPVFCFCEVSGTS